MRELYVFLFILIGTQLFAQKQHFKGATISNYSKDQIDKYFTDYQVVDFSTKQLKKEVSKRDYEGVFILDLTKEHKWEIFLHETEIRSSNYTVHLSTATGEFEAAPSPVKTFKGILNNARGERVSLTIADGFLYGYVTSNNVKYFIEPASYFDAKAKKDQYIVYSELDVVPSKNNKCAATELHKHSNEEHTFEPQRSSQACYEVELAIASDYSMYQKYGSQNGVENHNIGVMNNVAADYDDNFNEEIKFKIVTQYQSICNTCDPWTADRAAGTLLGSFRTWGQGGGFGVPFDLGQIWTNRDFNGGTIGVAYISGNGTPCTSLKYHAIQDFSTNASLIRVVVSHEIGHNFASGHDGGGGFIMSPFVNNTNVWSPNSQNAINNTIFGKSSNGCFSLCPLPPPPDDPNILPLEAVYTKNDETCFGYKDGEICVSISGGKEPYNVFWSVFGNTGLCFSDLSPGTYSCTVVDNLFNSVEINDIEILGSDSDLSLDLLEITADDCEDDQFYSGSISVEAVGGTGPYQYGWTNNHLDANPPDMAAGEYFVTVFDSYGCEQNFGPFIIPAGSSPIVVANATSTIDCINSVTTLDASGSAEGSDFSYLWTTLNGNILNGATSLLAEVDQVGIYTLTVMNIVDGCENSIDIEVVGSMELPIVDIAEVQDLDCENSSLILDAANSSTGADFIYTWTASNGGSILSGENTLNPAIDAAGTYTLTITNTVNGCIETSSISVMDNSEELQVTFDNPADLSCLLQSIPFSVNLSSSSTNVSYSWTTPSGSTTVFMNDNTIDLTEAGNYELEVTNLDNGCTYNTTIPVVANITAPIADAGATTVIGCDGNAVILNGNNSSTGPNYTYQWTTTDGSIVSNDASLNPEIDQVGNYILIVTDTSNGCTAMSVTTVTEDITTPDPSLSADGSIDCFTNNVNVTAQDLANLNVSYIWTTQNGTIVSGSNTNQIVVSTAGTYQVEMTNQSNACSSIESITVSENSNLPTASAGPSVEINCFNSTVVLDGSASSVGNNFTYQWSGNGIVSGADGLNPTVDQSGAYVLVVADSSNGCTASSVVEVLLNVTAPIADAGTGGFLGCNTNSVILDASTSSAGNEYSYAWSGPGIIAGGTTLNPEVNQAGTYILTVTNTSNGCSESAMVEVGQNVELPIADPGQNNLIPCDQTSLLLGEGNTSGGAQFTYLWTTSDGSILTNPEAVLVEVGSAGSYTLVVSNTTNGCSSTETITVEALAELETEIAQTNQILCNGNAEAAISLNVLNGSGSYTYQWSNGVTTMINSGLAAGTYSVMVMDASGCSATQSITISEPEALSENGGFTNETIFEGNNGTINLNVFGGTPPYTYNWSNGASSGAITDLAPGTYTVTILDALGCEISRTFSIQAYDCDLIVELSTSDVLCFGEANGGANAAVTGRNNQELFTWTDEDGNLVSNEAMASNLSAGSYTVLVEDTDGCTFISTVEISEPAELSLGLNTTQISSVGAEDASIEAKLSGGIQPYTYEWFLDGEIYQGDEASITNLIAGEYLLIAMDANGCAIQLSTQINDVSCNLETSLESEDVSCFGMSNGIITVSPSLGTAPYTFEWSNQMTTATIAELEAGTYTVSTTDALACVSISTVEITEPQVLNYESVIDEVNCNGEATGSFSIEVEGGTAPYSIAWENGFSELNESNVGAGTYNALLSDVNDCNLPIEIVIQEPSLLTLDSELSEVSMNGAMDASIEINPNGGISPYQYLWSNGMTTNNLENLGPGEYSVLVTDANGCTEEASFSISEPSQLTASLEITNVNCNGEFNGAALLTAVSGTEPFTYLWSDGSTGIGIVEQAAGNYTVQIQDATGAIITLDVIITEPEDIITSAASTRVTCVDDTDGAASISATGGVEPYTFNWDINLDGSEQNNLAAGSYEVTVTDANGCIAIHIVVVDSPEPISNELLIVDVSCYGLLDGSISIPSIAGGTPPYLLEWSTGETGLIINDLEPGTYEVSINDSNGCQKTQSISINEPDILMINLELLQNVSTTNGADGSIDVTIDGGVTPFSYNWSNGATTEDLSNLEAGNYQLEVTDSNGCILLSQTFTVTMPTSNEELANVDYFKISPNPSTDVFVLDLELNQAETFTVSFYNLAGQLIMQEAQITSQKIKKTFDFSEEVSGIYLMKIQFENGHIVEKLSLIK